MFYKKILLEKVFKIKIYKQKKVKKRVQRATSNVFAMFEQSQVQEFKEAFGLFDQDRDGVISVDDLKEVYASLGTNQIY